MDEIQKQIAYLDAIAAEIVVPLLRSGARTYDGAHLVEQAQALMTVILGVARAEDSRRAALLRSYTLYLQSIIDVAIRAGY